MTRPFLLAAVLLGAAFPAFAQQGVPGAQFILNWDADRDGGVTLAEMELRRGDIFAMFDADGDGSLSAAEWQGVAEHLAADAATGGQGHGGGQGNGGGMGPGAAIHASMTVEANDADADGTVTEAEFVATAAALFSALDRTGDGVLTADDFGRI